jgi:hypothetical protein
MLTDTLSRRRLVGVACAALALLASVSAQSPSSTPYDAVVLRNVMIMMRDGVSLATDVYLPARDGRPVDGKFPALMERTPYDKAGTATMATYFVSHGYAFVAQDVRGRYASQGHWRVHRDDGPDGFDTAAWIGKQPWFGGKLGTVGTSYSGGTQHALAMANPPQLAAIVPVDAMANYGRYGIRHNGAFELRWFNWVFTLGNATTLPAAATASARAAADPASRPALETMIQNVPQYVSSLPLRRGTTPLALAPDYESWLIEAMSHGDNDAFWKDMGASVVDHVAEYKDVPAMHFTGWYDSWGTPVANLTYLELSKAKKSPQRLIVGPWTHGAQARSYAGEAEFGKDAALDMNALRLRWFDRWLKGEDNGVDRDPPVRLFVMGDGTPPAPVKTPEGRVFVGGKWRDEREWPLARTKPTSYYLVAGGALSPDKPTRDVAPTRFLFDPRHPVPTIGGNVSSQGVLMVQGAADQKCRKDFWLCADTLPLSARNDILVFQTPALTNDTEVTGRLVVKLWIASNAPDTDFTAKLVDVYPPSPDFPAGIDLNVGDSIVRTRYRDSLEHAAMMTPGQVYEVTIEMYPTSLVFRRGHRIRLDISSSNFPRFDVNPNTGEPLNDNRRWTIAENSVYHDAAHPSQIVLPIIPR